MISVIIPVYNVEKCLGRCIDSVISQSYTDIEILLINDGSSDQSGEICDQFAAVDERIYVFHKQNGGVSSARNVGLSKATGDWIMFVDSDDTLPSDSLERLYKETQADGVSFVMAGYKKVGEDGNVTFSNESNRKVASSKSELLVQMFCPTEYPYWGYVWSKLFKRDVISTNKIKFDERIFFNEDRLFCVEYICRMAGEGSMLLESCYNYHENSSSAMGSLNKTYNPKFVTGFFAYIKMYELVKAVGVNRRIRTSVEEGIENAYLWNMSLMKTHNAYDSQTVKNMRRGLHGNRLLRRIIIIELKNTLRRFMWLMFPNIAIRYKN